MIEIPRLLAGRLRSMFRRLGLRTSTHSDPSVYFDAGADGLRIRALAGDTAIEYHHPGEFASRQFSVPLSVLSEAEGTTHQKITFSPHADGGMQMEWPEGPIPQRRVVDDTGTLPDAFPKLPGNLTPNPAPLAEALRHALASVDREAGARYALNAFKLEGAAGRIVTTDGHQLLVQGGFEFPWQDDVIIPASKLFQAAELPRDDPIAVGRNGDWIALVFGPWVLYLKHNGEARFPKYHWLLGDPATAQTTLSLSDADADFLYRSLDVMPAENDAHRPVTIDLNGHVAVRSRADNQSPPTEIELTNSRFTGNPLRISCDRRFLARAIKIGFRQVACNSPDSILFCDDGRRHYLWMPLDKTADVPQADDAIRIASPTASDAAHAPTLSRRRHTVPKTISKTSHPPAVTNAEDSAAEPAPPLPETMPATSPAATPTESPAASTDARAAPRKRRGQHAAASASTLEQAQAVCEALRVALDSSRELVRVMKRQKRQRQLVESTLASLQQLQSVA